MKTRNFQYPKFTQTFFRSICVFVFSHFSLIVRSNPSLNIPHTLLLILYFFIFYYIYIYTFPYKKYFDAQPSPLLLFVKINKKHKLNEKLFILVFGFLTFYVFLHFSYNFPIPWKSTKNIYWTKKLVFWPSTFFYTFLTIFLSPENQQKTYIERKN